MATENLSLKIIVLLITCTLYIRIILTTSGIKAAHVLCFGVFYIHSLRLVHVTTGKYEEPVDGLQAR
jgi:hypothetical protein